jgi:hypothetical protein
LYQDYENYSWSWTTDNLIDAKAFQC